MHFQVQSTGLHSHLSYTDTWLVAAWLLGINLTWSYLASNQAERKGPWAPCSCSMVGQPGLHFWLKVLSNPCTCPGPKYILVHVKILCSYILHPVNECARIKDAYSVHTYIHL